MRLSELDRAFSENDHLLPQMTVSFIEKCRGYREIGRQGSRDASRDSGMREVRVVTERKRNHKKQTTKVAKQCCCQDGQGVSARRRARAMPYSRLERDVNQQEEAELQRLEGRHGDAAGDGKM